MWISVKLGLDPPCARPILRKQIVRKARETAMSASHKVSDSNFETEVLNANGPVVVDFWAEWCGPCKAMSPLIDELAGELGAKAKVVKINIDESPNAPTKYGVRGIPTFMVFKDGQVVDSRVGSMSKSQLNDWVQSVI